MTRVNVVPVAELADQHVMIEYREITRLVNYYLKSLCSPKGIGTIPAEYTMGKGHVKFFYDKGRYLEWRYDQLCRELQFRGFNINPVTPLFSVIPTPRAYWPTGAEQQTNRQRLQEKIAMRPDWYRWTKRTAPIYYLASLGTM